MSQYDEPTSKKAVALRYDENRDAAPIIVASGMGHMAEKIVEIANTNGVPVYEDNSLATMLTQLELGREIPPELYQTIVDIYVYFLKFAVGEDGAHENKARENKAAEAEKTKEEAAETGAMEDEGKKPS